MSGTLRRKQEFWRLRHEEGELYIVFVISYGLVVLLYSCGLERDFNEIGPVGFLFLETHFILGGCTLKGVGWSVWRDVVLFAVWCGVELFGMGCMGGVHVWLASGCCCVERMEFAD